MYRVYFSTAGSGRVPPREQDRWPFKEFATLREALLWTQGYMDRGGAVASIEGDDGTQLSSNEIASCVQQTPLQDVSLSTGAES